MKVAAWILLLLTVAACGPSDSPSSDARASNTPNQAEVAPPTSQAPSGPSARVFPDSSVQTSYEVAVQGLFPPPA